jgi:transposase
MFVRVKTTPNSPRQSVQIVQSVRKGDKVSQKIVRYVGIAHDDEELQKLLLLAESIKIKMEADSQQLLFPPEELAAMNRRQASLPEKEEDYQVNLKNLIEEQRTIRGIHDIYGSLFEALGLSKILPNPARQKSSVEMMKQMVMARIANPQSKRASVEMLEEDFGISLSLDKVYKMMDKLDEKAIEKLNAQVYQHSVNLLGGKLDLMLFDCTTLYFECFEEDDFKRNGYSKDGKFNQPQVLLALMVTKDGLPVGYRVFPGNTYEGHTLIPVLRELKSKYTLDKIIFVADAGLLNQENITELETLEAHGFEYIVGSRLKNLPQSLQQAVLDPSQYITLENGQRLGQFHYKGKKLVVSYSPKRARKAVHDRTQALQKLEKKLKESQNPKEYLSHQGYKKYLKITGEGLFELDVERLEKESRWDGLHGVVTNSQVLSHEEILQQYSQLWEIENAFRITKHDLKVRPIFHWKPRRVKAHLAISFMSYTLVKHLAYRVRLQYKALSPEAIRKNLIRVQTSILFDTKKHIRYGFPSRISEHARKIYKICGVTHKLTPYIIEKKCSA